MQISSPPETQCYWVPWWQTLELLFSQVLLCVCVCVGISVTLSLRAHPAIQLSPASVPSDEVAIMQGPFRSSLLPKNRLLGGPEQIVTM